MQAQPTINIMVSQDVLRLARVAAERARFWRLMAVAELAVFAVVVIGAAAAR
jgi:hypothetical protein